MVLAKRLPTVPVNNLLRSALPFLINYKWFTNQHLGISFQNQFSSVALCIESFKIGAELWEEESGTEIFNRMLSFLLCFNFMAVNTIMSSEVSTSAANEVRYWWRSLTLQDRLYSWTGLWLDSAVVSQQGNVCERIEAHDPDLAALGWSELCGEWFWKDMEKFSLLTRVLFPPISQDSIYHPYVWETWVEK